MGISWRRSIWRSRKACATRITHIMFVVYTRLFMGSNNLPRLVLGAPYFLALSRFCYIPCRLVFFFFYSCGNTLLYFLVYVEDLIITKSDPSLVNTIIQQLDSKFSAKDLGPLSYFCGVKVLATSTSLILSQQKYAIDLLTKHNMLNSKHVSTLLVICTSLAAHDGTTPINATTYHQVVGGLQHLRMTQPDISFVMNKLSQFMHASLGSG